MEREPGFCLGRSPDQPARLARRVSRKVSTPPESGGDGAWGRSTEYVKDTVERFSKDWFPILNPAAINVAGFSTGMEYPGIIFDGIDDKGKTLFWISRRRDRAYLVPHDRGIE